MHRVYYHKDGSGNPKRCEDFTGFLNLVNIIEHIIGVPLEVFGNVKQKDAIKESEKYIRFNKDKFDTEYSKQLREYVGSKFNILLGLFKSSYKYELKDITIGTRKGLLDGNPYDRFDGKIEIEGSNQALGSFMFRVNTIAGHEWTDLVSETSKAELIDHREDLKNNPIFTQFTNHEDLLNSLKQTDKKYSNDFYNLYASGLLTSNDARIAFLDQINKLTIIPDYLKTVISKILGEINWEDVTTAQKGYQPLLNLLQREELDEKVFSGIKSIQLGVMKNIQTCLTQPLPAEAGRLII